MVLPPKNNQYFLTSYVLSTCILLGFYYSEEVLRYLNR